jgi:hypothetical protein
MDRDLEAPCITCTGYSNYVKGTVYMTQSHASKTLNEAIDDWYKDGVDQVQEDFWVSYKGITHDPVEKPKHYMLFDAEFVNATAYLKEGIEVRDVIEKLASKFDYQGYPNDAPLFVADYVQMMQYLMRFMDKNGAEDLKKARWYLDKLIQAYNAEDSV